MSVQTIFKEHIQEFRDLGHESDPLQTYDNFLELFVKIITNTSKFGDQRKTDLKQTLLRLILNSEIGEEEAGIPFEQVQVLFTLLNEDFGYVLKQLKYYDADRLVKIDYMKSPEKDFEIGFEYE